MESRDLGLPVAAIAVQDGVPVYDRDDERIGVVEHALIDEVTKIFEGLVIHTHPLPGRHLFAAPEQIDEMYERGVKLSVTRDALYEPSAEPGRRRRDAGDPPLEARIERALRRAWDWITGG